MPKAKTTTKTSAKKDSDLEGAVLKLVDSVGQLVATLQEDKDKQPPKGEEISTEKLRSILEVEEGQPMATVKEPGEFPVPPEYTEVVYHVLNKSFGVNLVPLADQPAFQFNIVVPEKYSSLSEEKRKMLGADLRSRVITYADGVNGVRQWTETVWSSFAPDQQALIANDRQHGL